MKIEGYVISGPVRYSDRKWNHHYESFDKTPQSAWMRWLNAQPDDDNWFRLQHYWINLGYCPKKATIEVEE